MTLELNKIHLGDCVELGQEIESGSVDLILTDLPYGTIKNLGDANSVNHGMKNKTAWDMAIEPKKIYEIANRILRKNGKMVLFSQEPYTSHLINEAIPNVPFSYRMVWEKDHFANSLIAKKAPVSYYEDVLIFSKVHEFEGIHPLRLYFSKVREYIGLTKKALIDKIGQRADHVFRTESSQFSLCTETTYNDIVSVFGLHDMNGLKTYGELKKVDEQFKRTFASTFNLWEGNKYKSNILRYKKDYDGYHPTQKPVLLLEDLIKTFSNEGDLVVDLTVGSGSTLVAARNAGRDFIGIEKDEGYFNIANERIANIQPALNV